MTKDFIGLTKLPPLGTRAQLSSDKEAKITSQDLLKFAQLLDTCSIEEIVHYKVTRFLDKLGHFYPPGLHKKLTAKFEAPLIREMLKRNAGNQVQTAKALGINRNTLRKRMKEYRIPFDLYNQERS